MTDISLKQIKNDAYTKIYAWLQKPAIKHVLRDEHDDRGILNQPTEKQAQRDITNKDVANLRRAHGITHESELMFFVTQYPDPMVNTQGNRTARAEEVKALLQEHAGIESRIGIYRAGENVSVALIIDSDQEGFAEKLDKLSQGLESVTHTDLIQKASRKPRQR